jgi:GTPase SAR1 family protein
MYANVAMILVGNKIDLEHERKIAKRVATSEATALGIKYF